MRRTLPQQPHYFLETLQALVDEDAFLALESTTTYFQALLAGCTYPGPGWHVNQAQLVVDHVHDEAHSAVGIHPLGVGLPELGLHLGEETVECIQGVDLLAAESQDADCAVGLVDGELGIEGLD